MAKIIVQPVEQGIPVECLIEGNVKIYFPGTGTLTFPPDPKFCTPQGRPRRIEWILNPQYVEILTGPLYNRGHQKTFVVANDLVKSEERDYLEKMVEKICNQAFVSSGKFNLVVSSLQKEMMEIRTILNRLLEEKNLSKEKK